MLRAFGFADMDAAFRATGVRVVRGPQLFVDFPQIHRAVVDDADQGDAVPASVRVVQVSQGGDGGAVGVGQFDELPVEDRFTGHQAVPPFSSGASVSGGCGVLACRQGTHTVWARSASVTNGLVWHAVQTGQTVSSGCLAAAVMRAGWARGSSRIGRPVDFAIHGRPTLALQ